MVKDEDLGGAGSGRIMFDRSLDLIRWCIGVIQILKATSEERGDITQILDRVQFLENRPA